MSTLFGHLFSKTLPTNSSKSESFMTEALREIEASVDFIFKRVSGLLQSHEELKKLVLDKIREESKAKEYAYITDNTQRMRWLNTFIKSTTKTALGITDKGISSHDLNEQAPEPYRKFFAIEDFLDRGDWFEAFNNQYNSAMLTRNLKSKQKIPQ